MKLAMRSWLIGGLVAAFATMGLAPDALARDSRSRHTREKESRYVVVGVRDPSGSVLFEVVKSDQFRERQKQAVEDYKEAYKEWYIERKAAKKRGEKFEEKPPAKPLVKKVGKTFKKEDEAKEYADKCQEAYDRKHAPKEETGRGAQEEAEGRLAPRRGGAGRAR